MGLLHDCLNTNDGPHVRFHSGYGRHAIAGIGLTGEHSTTLIAWAAKCDADPTEENAIGAKNAAAAYTAAYTAAKAATYTAATYAATYAAADAAANKDKFLAEYAENVVQILIDMNAPGCEWLDVARLTA